MACLPHQQRSCSLLHLQSLEWCQDNRIFLSDGMSSYTGTKCFLEQSPTAQRKFQLPFSLSLPNCSQSAWLLFLGGNAQRQLVSEGPSKASLGVSLPPLISQACSLSVSGQHNICSQEGVMFSHMCWRDKRCQMSDLLVPFLAAWQKHQQKHWWKQDGQQAQKDLRKETERPCEGKG